MRKEEEDFIDLTKQDPHKYKKIMDSLVDKGWKKAKSMGIDVPFNEPGFRAEYNQWLDHCKRAKAEGWPTHMEEPKWEDFVGKHNFELVGFKEIRSKDGHSMESQWSYESLKSKNGVCVCYTETIEQWRARKKDLEESKSKNKKSS